MGRSVADCIMITLVALPPRNSSFLMEDTGCDCSPPQNIRLCSAARWNTEVPKISLNKTRNS
jgi:hypothetical protein